eukprot:3488197-Prorocentrum_lima.AAC.1
MASAVTLAGLSLLAWLPLSPTFSISVSARAKSHSDGEMGGLWPYSNQASFPCSLAAIVQSSSQIIWPS